LVDAPDFRVTIDPKPENGLRVTSQVMGDKPVTIRRERIGQKIGRLGSEDIARLDAALGGLGVCLGTRGLALCTHQGWSTMDIRPIRTDEDHRLDIN
jgi:hypothetical protein